jgi:hypothetical protein
MIEPAERARRQGNPILAVLTFVSAAGIAVIGYNSDSTVNRSIAFVGAVALVIAAVWRQVRARTVR